MSAVLNVLEQVIGGIYRAAGKEVNAGCRNLSNEQHHI
jgi:hypothetical protein